MIGLNLAIVAGITYLLSYRNAFERLSDSTKAVNAQADAVRELVKATNDLADAEFRRQLNEITPAAELELQVQQQSDAIAEALQRVTNRGKALSGAFQVINGETVALHGAYAASAQILRDYEGVVDDVVAAHEAFRNSAGDNDAVRAFGQAIDDIITSNDDLSDSTIEALGQFRKNIRTLETGTAELQRLEAQQRILNGTYSEADVNLVKYGNSLGRVGLRMRRRR